MIPTVILTGIMQMLVVITRLFGLKISGPSDTAEGIALAKAKKWQEGLSVQPFSYRDAAAFALIFSEVWRVRSMHGPYFSPHHGISIVREEFEELWEEVRDDTDDVNLRVEATQLGSTVVRFIADLCRIGCVACADRTCDNHKAQDQGFDFEVAKNDWDAKRRLLAISTKELQAELDRRASERQGRKAGTS